MIRLGNSVIMIINPDGSKTEFDSEELESRIIKSCISSGIKDMWIAEDITLSVEYALSSPENESRLFTAREINAIVIKILQETGYGEVAEKYRVCNHSSEIEISPDINILGSMINKHLGLTGSKLKIVVEKVREASLRIMISKAPPSLFLELAKHYRSELFSSADISSIREKAHSRRTFQLTREKILSETSMRTSELIKSGIIQISGVSRIFPAVKIDFRMMELASRLSLEPPVSELSVIPHFDIPAEGINDIVKTIENYLKSSVREKDVPVYLHVPDMSDFSLKYLDTAWPEGEGCCLEMLSFLENLLNCNVYKITMN